jgi:hypothetical protein
MPASVILFPLSKGAGVRLTAYPFSTAGSSA